MEYLPIQIDGLDEVKDKDIIEKLTREIDEIYRENPNPDSNTERKIIKATARALAEKHTRESE